MRGPLFFWRADVDVGMWLRQLGLEQYEQAFIDNAVDADVLPRLTADDLKEIGVSAVGHRRKLLDAIATLRPEEAPFPVVAQTPDPGRRQREGAAEQVDCESVVRVPHHHFEREHRMAKGD